MDTITVNASIDRQRAIWLATCEQHPALVVEGKTIEELHEKIPDALERANLPRDAKVSVLVRHDHGTAESAHCGK